MCGRYALHSHPDVVALQFKLASAPETEARYNIHPSNDILIVRQHAQRGRVCDRSRWGLVPSWANDAGIGNRLANAGGELFGLAGITELWRGQLRTVCLITTNANELMRGIHDRMPVIVPLQDYDAWLDPRNHVAGQFIRPYAAHLMRTHPVGKAVSDPANEGAGLIEPI